MNEQQIQYLFKVLNSIDKTLASIRSMLVFFTVLTILGLVLGGCNLVLSLL